MKRKPGEVAVIDPAGRKAPSAMRAGDSQRRTAAQVFVERVCDCFPTCLIFFGEWIRPNGNIYSSAHVSNVAGGITETDPEAIIYLFNCPTPPPLENDKKKSKFLSLYCSV